MSFDFGNTILGDALGFGGGDEDDASAAARKAAELAEKWWNQSAAVRDPVVNRLADFMNNGMDPTQSAMYAPNKLGVEQNYQSAMDNMLANLPQGGAMGDNLTSLEMGKAGSIIDLISKIVQDEYNKAYGIASGSPQQTFGGFDSAANLWNPVLGGQASDKGAQYGAIGNILG